MICIYSKDIKNGNKTRIRMEHQECPNKTLEKAMKENQILKECSAESYTCRCIRESSLMTESSTNRFLVIKNFIIISLIS
jgi:hypothetical protein